MLSSTEVLPNFLKTVLFAAAASMSLSAFAGHHEEAEVGDLKDMSAESATELTADEAASELKADMVEGADAVEAAAEEAEMAAKAEVAPE